MWAKIKWIDPFTYSDLLLKKINPSEHWSVKFGVELGTAFLSAFVLYTIVGLIMGSSMPLVIVVSGSMEPVLHRGDVVLLKGVQTIDDLKTQEVTINRNLKGLGFWDFGHVNYYPDPGAIPLNSNLPGQRTGRGVYSITIEDQNYRFQTDGDIIVYFSHMTGRMPEAIIHRAVLKIKALDGEYVLTKGDANPPFDQDCGRVITGIPEYPCITLYPIPIEEIQGKSAGFVPLIGFVKLVLVDDLTQFLQGCPKTLSCPTGCCFP
ncbi:hypothetical protein KJ972_01340 [Candidatus Micrarchaeota archaeon]|nr:hypothetical protein [Candidatus Micrarchaeota archaeon]